LILAGDNEKEGLKMRRRLRAVLFLAVVGLVGCGSSESIMLDPSKLKPETAEEARASKAYDDKINEEEGGASFGKNSKPGGAGR
jgi:hypothetical protein